MDIYWKNLSTYHKPTNMVKFQKVNENCYSVTLNGDQEWSLWIYYSKANNHYSCDFGTKYFECKTIAEAKNKVKNYLL